MLKVYFQDLIEIQSLQNKIESLNAEVSSEKQRISDLNQQIHLKEESYVQQREELKKVENLLFQKESELSQTDKKISISMMNQTKVISEKQAQAINEEIQALIKFKKSLEGTILILWEQQDELIKSMNELENFQKGVSLSLQEIQAEVDGKLGIILKEKGILKDRESNLLSLLPQNFLNIFLVVNQRYKSNSLAYIEKNRCGVCKMSLPSSTCQEVDHQNTLETCPHCGRILLPHVTE